MRTTYVAIVYITKGFNKKVENVIKEKFENPNMLSLSPVEEFDRLRVKVKSSENMSSFKSRLNEIEGIGKTAIVEESFKIPKVSEWLLWGIFGGLVTSLVIFTIFSYYPPTIEDTSTRFEIFTSTEALIIEILFAIFITVLLIFREKKWHKDVSDALIEIQILASEIKQYVRSIEKKNS